VSQPISGRGEPSARPLPEAAEYDATRRDGRALGVEGRNPARDDVGLHELVNAHQSRRRVGATVEVPAPFGPATITTFGTRGF
jgi:hypothetical protein